jgi:Ni,Fe-hydrogenase maturation factor
MTQIQKLYEKIKNNPVGVSFDDLNKLMMHFGFEIKNKSSHFTFRHKNLIDIITVKKEPGHVKAVYVKKCLEAINILFKEV